MKTPVALISQPFSRIAFTIAVAASLCCGASNLWAQHQRPPWLDQELIEPPVNPYIEDLPPTPNPPTIDGNAPVESRPAFASDIGVANRSDTGVVPGVFGPNAWTELGPFPIPNGQTSGRVDPVSGRATAIAINPNNSNIVYVGTAQGGVYRSLNGGTTWVQLMDNAPSGIVGCPLAIGSVIVDPLNSSRIYVGTGEGNLSGDSFFGNGLYIIDNADSFNPIVKGAFVVGGEIGSALNNNIFTGRSIVAIVDSPVSLNGGVDDGVIFAATSSGIGGLYGTTYSNLPPRGLYRNPNINQNNGGRFVRLVVNAAEPNAIMTDVKQDPGNPNVIVTALYSQTSGGTRGGIYRSTNALAINPAAVAFTKTLALPDFTNVKLAFSELGADVVVWATADQFGGTLYQSIDGGVTFVERPAARGFAGGQGFYDLSVGCDPTDTDDVYIGGAAGSGIFRRSTNGGASFQVRQTGLHADVHAIGVAPSDPNTIYHANDGGIWVTHDMGTTWTSLNNNTFSATQFTSIALHPRDRNFTIGGTQDNGTEQLRPDGTFTRADFGDGGFALIDQNASDTVTLTEYHTYFNISGSLIGTGRVLKNSCANNDPTGLTPNWSFHGIYGGALDPTVYCDGSTDTFNGILITDAVQFYAPQVLGPGNPNTWFFGTDTLYKSTDQADTAADIVSGLCTGVGCTGAHGFETGVTVTAIGIGPQDEFVKLVGLSNGHVYASAACGPFIGQWAEIAGPSTPNATPATPVERIIIDPSNHFTAYICWGGFGTPGAPIQHVWKTTTLNNLCVNTFPVLNPSSNGIPDIPVNAGAIDPFKFNANGSTDIYVGTDDGVYFSADAGLSWAPYGIGFPHVAVFGLEIQNANRLVRAATHGRGLYEIKTFSGTGISGPGGAGAQALNLSTRAFVGSGDQREILGVIIEGGASKQVLFRGLGPTLQQSGISGFLADPTLTLFDGSGNQLAFNDNWRDSQQAAIQATGKAPQFDSESAILATLPPGGYTVILGGKNNTTGVGLVEVFDLDTGAPASRFDDVSTRGLVLTGNQVMIAGVILGRSNGPANVYFRGLGPSLTGKGVPGALQDPTIELHDGFGNLIRSNDNWQDDPNQAGLVAAAGLAPSDPRESAIAAVLNPGNYTLIEAGKNTTTGVGQVEIFVR